MIDTLYILAVAAMLFYRCDFYMHMFQLNSYREERFFKWLKQGNLFKPADVLSSIGILIFFFGFKFLGIAITLIGFMLTHLIYRHRAIKKKLVYTKRVKRMFGSLTLITLLLLIPIILMKNIWTILLLLILNTFSYVLVVLSNIVNRPIEKAYNNYYINDAKRMIKENRNLIVIGITGSYGKTSAKNILYTLLSKQYNVLMTPHSYNTTMGVVRTIRENLKPTHQIFIAEMGAKQLGDIKEICDIVTPDIGIITSIGPQHLETFKSIENVIKTKGELFHGVKAGGKIIELIDDENVQKVERRNDVDYITVSLKNDALYKASDIQITNKGTSFNYKHHDNSTEMVMKLLGEHNLSNVMLSMACASQLNVKDQPLSTQLKQVKPIEHRLSIKKSGLGYTIIDDAFNSNPKGSKYALDVLKAFDGNKKAIITPGMIELGDLQYDLNKKFGEYISEACNLVILVGNKQTQPIQDGLKAMNYPTEKLFVANDLKEGFDYINRMLSEGDCLLIENDLPDTFNE